MNPWLRTCAKSSTVSRPSARETSVSRLMRGSWVERLGGCASDAMERLARAVQFQALGEAVGEVVLAAGAGELLGAGGGGSAAVEPPRLRVRRRQRIEGDRVLVAA